MGGAKKSADREKRRMRKMVVDETGQGMTGGAPEAQQAAEAPVSAPVAGSTPPAKSNKKWWFIGCGCLFVLCLLVTSVAAIIGAVW